MSKAILILKKMPETCLGCRFCNQDTICLVAVKEINGIDIMTEKPDWCPLRPLPERKPYIGPNAIWGSLDSRVEISLHEATKLAWNACLDEIEGK